MWKQNKAWLINKHSVSCTLILRLLVVTAVTLLFSIFLALERVWADSMIKNVTVGNIPASVAFNPSNGYTYVTNVDSNTVSVIDGSTNTVIDTIPMGEWLAAKNSDSQQIVSTKKL